MTLQERLTTEHANAARLYLRRQELEGHRQQLAQQAQAVELALVRSDGAVELLQALIADAAKVPDGV